MTPDPTTTWTRLEIIDATGDEVAFRAHFEGPDGPGLLEERSRFERRAARWFYVEAL